MPYASDFGFSIEGQRPQANTCPPYYLAILDAKADAAMYANATLSVDQDNPVIHVIADGHIVARHWFREGA